MRYILEGLTPYAVDVIAPMTVLSLIAAVLLLLTWGFHRVSGKKTCPGIILFVSRYAILIVFLVSFSATIGSLFFSEIAQWVPCKLCWFQRIFFYPMSIIALLALVRRDKGILPYLLLLACFGVLISSFHYYEQVRALLDPVGFDPHTPCDLTGISCRATYVLQYGFVTIPLMSFALFSLSAVTAWIALQCQKK